MGKLSLLIADSDENYLQKLGNYFMLRYSGRFNIHLFSSPENLKLFLKTAEKPQDILLYSDFFPKEALESERVHTLIQLSDNNMQNTEGTNMVFKYRHAESLVQDILHIYSRSSLDAFVPDGKTAAEIYAVHSAAGGTGKTSIAAGLSMLAARRNMKPLYLNFESTPSTAFYFKGRSERTLSDVIYYLKERGLNLATMLEGACCCDPAGGVHYFLPPDSACEFDELTDEDIDLFLGTIRASSLFDIVFIDLPSGLSHRNSIILRSCDKIVNVCAHGAFPLFKKSVMEGDPVSHGEEGKNELSSRTVHVLNRYSENACTHWCEKDYTGKFSIIIRESERLGLNDGERLLIDMDPIFSASVGKLLDSLAVSGDGKGCRVKGGAAFA